MPATIDAPVITAPVITDTTETTPINAFSAQVIVFNDDTFPLLDAMTALIEVLPGMTAEKAFALTSKIEADGHTAVFSGAREICELYAEQLNGRGLDAQYG